MNSFRKSAPKIPTTFEAIPTGEVIEGNAESDWAAWEDSVAFQDSLMPELLGSVTVSTKGLPAKPVAKVPAQLEEQPGPKRYTGPAIEVKEGNAEDDWAEWEDSVLMQDIQALQTAAKPAPAPSSQVVADLTVEHVDIFASVHKKGA